MTCGKSEKGCRQTGEVFHAEHYAITLLYVHQYAYTCKHLKAQAEIDLSRYAAKDLLDALEKLLTRKNALGCRKSPAQAKLGRATLEMMNWAS